MKPSQESKKNGRRRKKTRSSKPSFEKMTKEEILESAGRCDGFATYALFIGPYAFFVLLEAGWMRPDYTMVRLYKYGQMIDTHFRVNGEGWLVDIQDENETLQDPNEVLSIENAPDGWNIWNLRIPRSSS